MRTMNDKVTKNNKVTENDSEDEERQSDKKRQNDEERRSDGGRQRGRRTTDVAGVARPTTRRARTTGAVERQNYSILRC